MFHGLTASQVFSQSPVEGHPGSFQFSAIMDTISRNIHVQFFCECMLSFLIYFISLFFWDCAEWGGIKIWDVGLRSSSTVDEVVKVKFEK